MATVNPFDLLGGDDSEDLSKLIAAQLEKVAAAPPPPKKALVPVAQPKEKPSPKLPSKPLPPAQAVREAKNDNNRGRGRGSGRGFGRGRVGGEFNRDVVNSENSFSNSGVPGGQVTSEVGDFGKPSERRGYGGPRTYNRGGGGRRVNSENSFSNSGVPGGQVTSEGGDFGKPSERHGYGGPRTYNRGGGGGRRSGFNDGEAVDEEQPRRAYDRRSGTGRGNDFKREGAGRANWGTPTDEIAPESEEINDSEIRVEKPLREENAGDDKKEPPVNESEEKDHEEDKEMTLEEYEKVLDEKRKALLVLKTEERKVDVDKEFGSMQQLSSKKSNADVFIKLGSDKDKRKEVSEKEEKAKKSVSINEFLKPAEGGEKHYSGGRGRGRGRGHGRDYREYGGKQMSNFAAPSIEDPSQFPTLGAK